MEIGIKVVAENIRARTVRHTNSCYFTMVALDEAGKTVPVPALTLDNETHKKRFREAEIRKKMRIEAAARIRESAE
jgi:acyl-CoA hydrolase